MKVGVIGYGVVGGATAELLRRLGHEVWVRDTSSAAAERAKSDGFWHLGPATELEVVFLCVPEAEVPGTVATISGSPVTVVRSTVPPGTTDRLSLELGRPLVHMPEFLKEAAALWDVLNPNFVLIGSRDSEHAAVVARIFEPMLVPVVVVPPDTSEMVKLALNCYLHTIVSFWNEIHLICDGTGISSHQVGRLCSQDPRVTTYGANMHEKPVGGRCLPKDIAQLIEFSRGRGYDPQLLNAAQQVNDRLSSNVDRRPEEPINRTEWQHFELNGDGRSKPKSASHVGGGKSKENGIQDSGVHHHSDASDEA